MGVSVLRGQGVGLPTVKVSFWPGVRNWEFTEPLDLDRAVAVEIWNWHIPLTGPEAGVVRPK